MRRLAATAGLVLALVVAPAAAAGPLFVVSGKGWGHGVGMSQYGAYGFARNGWTYDRILSYYYQGTTLGPAPISQVRVLVAEGRRALRIGSDAPFGVVDAAGSSYDLEAGMVRLSPSLELSIGGQAQTLVPPVRFEPGDQPLELDRPYRGTIAITSTRGKLAAVNELGLEAYLYGVVAREMPASWAPEALKAQAVAARSYALSSLSTGGSFDLYADTRSQVYGGLNSEDPRTNAAVDATAGQVLLYGGAVAKTFFFSTSGGRTAACGDVFGQPLPYLQAVDDPYDTLSPYHSWGPVVFTGRELAKRVGARAPSGLRDVLVTRDGSGRAGSATLVGATATTEVRGTDMRSLLGLRSTWFDVGVLSLTPLPAQILIGQKAPLAGVARGVEGATLEQKVPGGAWEPVAAVKAKDDGTFASATKPRTTTLYRLASPSASGSVIRVRVAARISLDPPAGRKQLRGRVRPKLEGVAVEIQRLQGRRWHTVAETTTAAKGEFRAKLALTPGTYRAVARVGGGLVPGITAPLELP